MNYIKELIELQDKQCDLIEQAEKEGYSFINGRLTKDEYIPVIEIYARAETDYESSGCYYILKKVIPLTEERLVEIKSLEITKENIVEEFVYGQLANIDDKDLRDFYEILEVGRELEVEDIKYFVGKDCLDEEYSLEDNQKLYLEFFFGKDNLDGYISVFDMPIEDFNKHDAVNLFLRKYLTMN